MTEELHFDSVIVGAGTAGCVLANRLSEDSGHQVALIEAGPDFGPADSGQWPAEIQAAAYTDTQYDWGYSTEIAGRTIWYKRGKVMGGSSSINATGINWGLQQDYDDWAARGNPGWSFSELLPFFQRVERLLNDEAPSRGVDGKLPVTRSAVESPYLSDLERAYTARGVKPAQDISGPHAPTGFGQGTRNSVDGQRWHSARAYLDEARDRPNLTILAQVTADRLEWANGRVSALLGYQGTRQLRITADRFVLSAGAVGSPLILMRSRIGPEAVIRAAAGPGPLLDLPGVGRNLRDHFGVSFAMRAAAGTRARLQPSLERNPRQSLLLRLPSRPELDAFDLDVFATQGLPAGMTHSDDVFDEREGVLGWSIFLVHPACEGSIEITGAHPATPPRIVTGFGERREDLSALASGIEWLRETARAPEVRDWYDGEAFPGAGLKGSDLEDYCLRNVRLFHHATGTCKMGPHSDPLAVVDAGGRLHGLDNLWAADASIMPMIPRGMINLTVYAIAEKIAEGLRQPV